MTDDLRSLVQVQGYLSDPVSACFADAHLGECVDAVDQNRRGLATHHMQCARDAKRFCDRGRR